MPYGTPIVITFNPDDYPGADEAARQAAAIAVARQLFGTYNGGNTTDTLQPKAEQTIASPEVVFAGVDSHAKAFMSPNPVEVQGGFATKEAMDADLDAANGLKVNCYDADGTKRGRYIKNGPPNEGAWVFEGAIEDRLWDDPNHQNRLLNIMPFGSYINSFPPWTLSGPARAFPAAPNDNYTNARLTLTLRAVGLTLGGRVKIAMHCQGPIASRTALLPQVHPVGNWFVPNYINTAQLISDALGFAQPGSWGKPNLVPSVEDSGWVDVVIDFKPDDTVWTNLGRIARSLAVSPFHYGCAPVAELFASLTGNIYMLVLYDKPQPDATFFASCLSIGVKSFERITGSLLLKQMKFEFFTPDAPG